MSNELVRAILAIIVGAHGVGHVLFLVAVLGIADWGQSSHSWLLSNESAAKIAGGIIWGVALLGFVAAAIGLFGELAWWRTVAVIVSIVSLVGLALFWDNPPTQPAVAAAVFNVVVLLALLVFKWPSTSVAGP
jgi:hypothetical protein